LDFNARTWGYHTLWAEAGVDFSYMLYAEQVGAPVATCKSQSGITCVRMTTDVAAAFMEFVGGDLKIRSYLRSLRPCQVDAVFSLEDPLPGLAEILLIPYLVLKRGW